MKTITTLCAAVSIIAFASGCATRAGQQTNSTTAPSPAPSITDKAIHGDYMRYEAQQEAIKKINDSGRHRVASYSLAKAQCWLDVSLHEYSRNDRSHFPRLAYDESVKITDYLGKGGDVAGANNPANQTPLVNDAAKLRPDLWEAAAKLKGHSGWRCAEQKTACAEVELVHAGNEFNQQQWRHAKPYVQIAEDLIGDAQKAAEACNPPPAPAAPAAASPAAPAPAAQPISASANVLFNFDKRDLANVRPYTKDQLDSLIGQIKSSAITVNSIQLIGHADRLNSTGNANYNVKLSQDRVETIRSYMVSQGVPANLISTAYKADSEQIQACTKAKFRNNAELQECLLPNRRVEVVLSGVRK
jgi:outer membrane protein OmpA-like peptidoglycan-associated protein